MNHNFDFNVLDLSPTPTNLPGLGVSYLTFLPMRNTLRPPVGILSLDICEPKILLLQWSVAEKDQREREPSSSVVEDVIGGDKIA